MLDKIWGYLVAGTGALLAVLVALASAKRAGKKEERAEQTEKALQQSKEANEIEDANRKLTRAELDERLRRFSRD